MARTTAPNELASNPYTNIQQYLLADSTTLVNGTLAMFNSGGLLIPSANTASCKFAGIVQIPTETVDSGTSNTTVYAGIIDPVTAGGADLDASGAGVTWLGCPAYASDNFTADITSNTGPCIGVIDFVYSSTKVHVDFRRKS